MILDWFYENINRFNNTSGIGEVWGKYERNGEEITSIYIISKVLKDFLADNDINFNGVKEKLLEKDYIETRNSIKEFTIPTNINGTKVRCVKINVKPEKNDLQYENEYVQQTTLEDLPFWGTQGTWKNGRVTSGSVPVEILETLILYKYIYI